MSNFKEASRIKLRFNTPSGVLGVEQLWDLSIEDLDKVAVSLDDHYEKSDVKSFIKKKSEKDKVAKLSLDIVLEVLDAKIAEQEKASAAAEAKAYNQKILGKIAEAKDKELDGKSVEELEAMLK